MSFPSEETAVCAGRRGRSYSDARALIDPKTSSSHTPSPAPPDITTTGGNAVVDARASGHKTTPGRKKHHSRHHRHHHNGDRPRSKSLDLHRHHSTPVHKRKHSNHQHRRVPLTHSPVGLHTGRASPPAPRLKGKMWIRVATDPPPFVPALPNVEPSPWQVVGRGFDQPMTIPPLDHAFSRQVSNTASSPSPTSLDDDVQPPGAHQRRGDGPARIAFGQNGKPIRPRTAFGPYDPNAAAL